MTQSVIECTLLEDRVIVWNPEEGSALYKEAFYGKPVGIRKPKTFDFDRPLELSLIEALYLLKQGKITIKNAKDGKSLSERKFERIASDFFDKFSDKFLIYSDLRNKGRIVKPGLKFGADFAVYEYGPGLDHAPFLVHVIPKGIKISAIEMVRAGRLATSVRKRFVIATISKQNNPNYFALSWFKP